MNNFSFLWAGLRVRPRITRHPVDGSISMAAVIDGAQQFQGETLHDGEEFGDLSTPVTIPPVFRNCDPPVVAIKDWSENDGVVEMLHEAGIIQVSPMFVLQHGFVQPKCFQLTASAAAIMETSHDENPGAHCFIRLGPA